MLAQPVYLYYGLTQYYQNHRRYIKLFSTDQMNGNEVGLDTVIGLLYRLKANAGATPPPTRTSVAASSPPASPALPLT